MSEATDLVAAIGGLSGFVALGVTAWDNFNRRRKEHREAFQLHVRTWDGDKIAVGVRFRPHDRAEGLVLEAKSVGEHGRLWPAPEPTYVTIVGDYRPPRRTDPGLGQRQISCDMAQENYDDPTMEVEFLTNGPSAAKLLLIVRSTATGEVRGRMTATVSPVE